MTPATGPHPLRSRLGRLLASAPLPAGVLGGGAPRHVGIGRLLAGAPLPAGVLGGGAPRRVGIGRLLAGAPLPAAALSDDLGDALARIAQALQVPVLLLALLVLAASALELGRFATEVWQRARRGRQALRAAAVEAVKRPHEAALLSEAAATPFAATALRALASAATSHEPEAVEYALADYELAAERRLDRTRILVRAGPAVGLMGTLIPLAPGLAALGNGNVASLASDLRTAFAATVVGLLAGTIAFALTLTRTRMYSEDLAALERATPPASTTLPASPEAGP